jgi:hypothetical protein
MWLSILHKFVFHSSTHLFMCQMCFQCMIFMCKNVWTYEWTTSHALLIYHMLNLWWTFVLCMTSFHTNLDINIINDFLMLVWMIGFDLFRNMVEWKVCKDNWICLKVLGWTMFLTYLLNFTYVRFYGQNRFLNAIDKGGKVLDNVL